MSAIRFISFDCSPYSEVQCLWHPRALGCCPATQCHPWHPRDLHAYESADYFGEDSEAQSNIYPNEFLNTLLQSGMPQHRLNLKVGAPIILIRNLNCAAGLMNGTRLSVTSCLRYTIQATVLTGTQNGNSVCIPRINLKLSVDDDIPIKFIRRQFPVKLAFCMTINKSQGQTFSKVGILLATRPFSHGQVYVALSRCGNSSAIKVWTAADLQVDANNYGVIENILWPEILDSDLPQFTTYMPSNFNVSYRE